MGQSILHFMSYKYLTALGDGVTVFYQGARM